MSQPGRSISPTPFSGELVSLQAPGGISFRSSRNTFLIALVVLSPLATVGLVLWLLPPMLIGASAAEKRASALEEAQFRNEVKNELRAIRSRIDQDSDVTRNRFVALESKLEKLERIK